MKTRNISLTPFGGAPGMVCFLIFLATCSYNHLRAQVAEWTFENIGSAVPGLPIPASRTMAQISATATVRGGNNNGSPDECFGNESWSTNFWPTSNGPEPDEYIEFSVRVTGEEAVEMTAFSFYSSASSSNSARRFTAYYSTDNFASAHFLLAATHSAGGCHPHSRSLSAIVQPGNALKVRIHSYGQNPAAQAATIRLDNVRVQGAVLPVTLASFSAQAHTGRVVLEWTTANEINNDHFVVERSLDGLAFEALGQVVGQGHSTTEHHYTFTDSDPRAGQNYYRLKQVDFDGTEEIHSIIPVYYKGHRSADFALWPTVVSDQLQFRLSADVQEGRLEIWDMNGRLVRQMTISNTEHVTTLAVNNLPEGAYALRFASERAQYTQRFFKQ